MVLEKRRQSVTAYDGHHGLKVLLNTFCFSEHQFDLTQFIISIGFSGRMELMTLIRKEIRKKRNKRNHKKEIDILDIDFNQIAVGLLESFGLMEPQPSPSKKAANLPVLVSTTGIDYPKKFDNEPTIQNNDKEYNNRFEDDFDDFHYSQQSWDEPTEQTNMPNLCVQFLDSILKNNLVTHVRQNWFAFPMYKGSPKASFNSYTPKLFGRLSY